MELSKIPGWAWGLVAVVVLFVLIKGKSAAAQPTTTTVGPVANAYAQQQQANAASGFSQIVGFANNLTNQQTAIAQINEQQTVGLAGIQASEVNAQTAADTSRAQIAAAQTVALTQSANQLASARSADKTSTGNTLINNIGNIAKGIVTLGGLL